ncbi:RelB/DinJ family addiction module antitoxin [Olsenella sp. SW781]|nr:RelB/DinJ family addiction module antitoxin [Olsenella sp. SW781]
MWYSVVRYNDLGRPAVDAMVTGRMSQAKKELGNQVLRELGTNASQAINELYDYVISRRALPFSASGEAREARLRAAVAAVDAVTRVELDERFAAMDVRQARAERLADAGLMGDGR